jgi:Ca2+-binding EF-hand superfamily protein
MNHKLLIAAAVATAFALPVFAQTSGKPAAGSSKSDGGAEAMFKSMDKDKDGSISKAEAKGTPHEKDFAKLDKNKDGKLSRAEHAAAAEHSGGTKGSAGGSKSGGQSSSSKY